MALFICVASENQNVCARTRQSLYGSYVPFGVIAADTMIAAAVEDEIKRVEVRRRREHIGQQPANLYSLLLRFLFRKIQCRGSNINSRNVEPPFRKVDGICARAAAPV